MKTFSANAFAVVWLTMVQQLAKYKKLESKNRKKFFGGWNVRKFPHKNSIAGLCTPFPDTKMGIKKAHNLDKSLKIYSQRKIFKKLCMTGPNRLIGG